MEFLNRFKFRAYNTDTKTYEYDYNKVYDLIKNMKDDNCHMIFEQCVGLKDKHGVFIFEKDILKFTFEGEEEFLPVYYNESKFSVGCNGCDAGWLYHDFLNNIEVVGNIHEDRERYLKLY